MSEINFKKLQKNLYIEIFEDKMNEIKNNISEENHMKLVKYVINSRIDKDIDYNQFKLAYKNFIRLINNYIKK